MTVFTVIAHQRLDDYAVVQTLTNTDVQPGQSITLAGLGHGLNGTHVVLFCPQYAFEGIEDSTGLWIYDPLVPRANQLLFRDAGDDLNFTTAVPTGTLTWSLTCTWITQEQIATYLGIAVAIGDETAFLTQCAAAANAVCYRRRYEAGYLEDSLSTSPSGDVTLATIMYGAALYRQRGSIDQFASFGDMATAPTTGLSPQIKMLLGVPRPQVA